MGEIARIRAQLMAGVRDKELEREAQQAIREVRLIKLETSGAMHIAEHVMEGAVRLNQTRRMLSASGGEDSALELELAEIYATGVYQAKALQRQYRTRW